MVGLSSARAAFSGGLGELDHLTGAQPATIEAGIDRRDVAPSPCVMEKLGGDAAQSIARRNGVGTCARLRGRGDSIWRRDPFSRLRRRVSGDLGLCWCVSRRSRAAPAREAAVRSPRSRHAACPSSNSREWFRLSSV